MRPRTMHHLLALTFVVVILPLTAPVEADQTAEIERRLAENPQDVSLLVAAGQSYLQEAQRGDGSALSKAEEYLDRALSREPENPQILVLHGSMLALKGRDATLPVMKMRHVQRGLEEMDHAVALAPMDFGVRYQRAAYCLNLPDVFERAGTAVEDFEHLLTMATRAPDLLSSEETIRIRLSLAQAKLKIGDAEEARALLESVIAAGPGTVYADEAKAILDEVDD